MSSRLRSAARPAVHVALVLTGVALGLLLALPIDNVDAKCPPRGEGFEFCYVQKAILPAIFIVLAGGLLGQWLARLVLVRVPAWRRRVRTHGERRAGQPETREEPPYRKDPFLLASTWGVKEGRHERRHPASRLLDRVRRR